LRRIFRPCPERRLNGENAAYQGSAELTADKPDAFWIFASSREHPSPWQTQFNFSEIINTFKSITYQTFDDSFLS
jgi:hypothetical protein